MEITILEDPACGWCWAFQPVLTCLEFELLCRSRGKGGKAGKGAVRLRRVMGGLRDRAVLDATIPVQHWQRAAEISGMPFRPSIWDRHLLRTTYVACRAIKAAASALGDSSADRLLRRIREAFLVEEVPVDDREALIEIARAEGLDADALRETLDSGRADFLFERDRREAAQYRFGFPTLLIRKQANDAPVILNGIVSLHEVIEALEGAGLRSSERHRFQDREEDWERLFAIHPRLTLAELRLVTSLEGQALEESMARNGIRCEEPFYLRGEPKPARPAPSASHLG